MNVLDGHTPKPVGITADDGVTWRSVAADAVVASVEPFYREVGITRVANVTGLDVIGIPVWQAIRPNGRGLAVSQGKGLTHAMAKASAVMESIECWHGERSEVPCRIDSFAGLAPTGRVIDPEALARDANGAYNPFAPIPFCPAVDLTRGTEWWVPFELVHTNMVVPFVAGSGTFARNTNGLASGATKAEAVLHGLCEVIERDAYAVWHAAQADARTRIDPATITEPASARLLAQFDEAGLDLFLWDLTCDTGVPCAAAVLWDPQADLDLNPTAASGGFGCHPDPRFAMTRALTEAAQSRLTVIAGARDDVTRSRRREVRHAEAYEHWHAARDADTPLAWQHPLPTTTSVEDDLRAVLATLRGARLAQVLVVDLSRPDWPISVVRVIVPGAEAPHETPAYTAGRRAHAARQRVNAARNVEGIEGDDVGGTT